jgi:hypothetical protein
MDDYINNCDFCGWYGRLKEIDGDAGLKHHVCSICVTEEATINIIRVKYAEMRKIRDEYCKKDE